MRNWGDSQASRPLAAPKSLTPSIFKNAPIVITCEACRMSQNSKSQDCHTQPEPRQIWDCPCLQISRLEPRHSECSHTAPCSCTLTHQFLSSVHHALGVGPALVQSTRPGFHVPTYVQITTAVCCSGLHHQHFCTGTFRAYTRPCLVWQPGGHHVSRLKHCRLNLRSGGGGQIRYNSRRSGDDWPVHFAAYCNASLK